MADHLFQEQQPFLDDQFDMFDWYPYFQSCVRYFLEHAQYNGPVQALAAFINIQLPFQKAENQAALLRAPPPNPGQHGPPPPHGGGPGGRLSPAAAAAAAAAAAGPGYPHPPHQPYHQHQHQHQQHVSLHPYIRRLVATGFDLPAVLHGFFGDDWELGISPLHEQERRNFLFAAKSSSWLEVKRAYDGADEEGAVPFLKPLRGVTEAEIVAAESGWSEWLAMQDWMLGPRSVEMRGVAGSSASGSGSAGAAGGGVRIKREEE
ncbi:hypothetical protein C8A01DRAFT_39695 [Parachaetomium inaequale]|uniref:Ilp is an apoptosis inhibitor n=1 Tax=Parachaetomium inaequale TaxID=2588326 RepID=A0AAN6PAM0_9PEZI|nr:hypothetical protein C8A01DRAFT_39695 [Parachaetomium inaequale]